MGRNVQATCTQNCLLFHGTAKPSPTSFFKVMADDDYFRVLYIPPKFSSTVSPLVNKKIILKDSSGQQWNVTVSNVDGSFAFGEGWNVFSVDHGLKIGYFLVFNYINELHFDVKIYDNSGCERLDFSTKRNQKKRSRDKGGKFVRQDPNSSVFSKQDVPKMKSQHKGEDDIGGTRNNRENISKYDGNNGRAQSVRISEHFEDPSHMTNREFEDKKRDDHTCGVDGTVKITTGSHVVNGSHIYQNDATKCNNKDPIFEGVLGTGGTSDASEFEISGRNNSLGETDKSTYDKSSTLKPDENRENKSIMSKRKVQECHFAEGLESEQAAISKKKHALHIGGFQNTKQMFDGISNHLGEMKKVPVEMTPTLCSFKDKLIAKGELSKKIKKELVTSDVYNNKDELGATDSVSWINLSCDCRRVAKGYKGRVRSQFSHV
ncbi:B3 domain-containing protein At4g34400-like isoform X2 [Gastrolobium bilobum]|uniref:B3 domain-containing protein At4g34400-like isoform X2 n=1 Tax=Gastrolobium bilobum TaxID=150636 RepID=UPI002AAFB2A9|nr:B3 domain-containing protein At4g34400-like isoform X2 [Gastrolobium bilobum]